MSDQAATIGLLKEAYEELENTGRDACECDDSVGLQCYPCRLREALHKHDPEWSCAADEESALFARSQRYARDSERYSGRPS